MAKDQIYLNFFDSLEIVRRILRGEARVTRGQARCYMIILVFYFQEFLLDVLLNIVRCDIINRMKLYT